VLNRFQIQSTTRGLVNPVQHFEHHLNNNILRKEDHEMNGKERGMDRRAFMKTSLAAGAGVVSRGQWAI
jgi:hypothetical protein